MLEFLHPRQTPWIIGLIGQSNALGTEAEANLQADLVANDSDCIEYGGFAEGWVTQIVRSGTFGTERRMLRASKLKFGNNQYLFKFAQGGSSIAVDWAPGGSLYQGYLTRMGQAQAKPIPAPFALGYKMRYVVFIIGESACTRDDWAASFQSDMQAFWDAFKVDFASGLETNVRLILPSLSSFQTSATISMTRKAIVNQAIIDFAAANSDVITFVQNNTCQADNLHYNAAGYNNFALQLVNVMY